MTENENPKPFNISCQKSQRQKLGGTALLVYQSINESINPFTVKLAEQNSNQRQSKCNRFVYRLVNPLFVIIK